MRQDSKALLLATSRLPAMSASCFGAHRLEGAVAGHAQGAPGPIERRQAEELHPAVARERHRARDPLQGFEGGVYGKTTGVSKYKGGGRTTLLWNVTFPLACAPSNKERDRRSTNRGATATRLEFQKRRDDKYRVLQTYVIFCSCTSGPLTSRFHCIAHIRTRTRTHARAVVVGWLGLGRGCRRPNLLNLMEG